VSGKRTHQAQQSNGPNRSLVTFYVAHPRARPCRLCGQMTDPQDIAYTLALVGVALCIACLRREEARARRDLEGHAPTLDEHEVRILADPRYHEGYPQTERREAAFVNARVPTPATQAPDEHTMGSP